MILAGKLLYWQILNTQTFFVSLNTYYIIFFQKYYIVFFYFFRFLLLMSSGLYKSLQEAKCIEYDQVNRHLAQMAVEQVRYFFFLLFKVFDNYWLLNYSLMLSAWFCTCFHFFNLDCNLLYENNLAKIYFMLYQFLRSECCNSLYY